MKRIVTMIAVLGLIAATASAQNVEWGDEAKMDTLSYASGVSVAFGMERQMKYVPFDYELFDKTIGNTALGVATLEEDSLTIVPEQLSGILNGFFGEKYPDRVKAAKAALDSIEVIDEESYIMGVVFDSEYERLLVSKAFGMNLGMGINKSDMPVQVYWVLAGMRDVRKGKAIMTGDAAAKYIHHYNTVTRYAEVKKRSGEWLSSIARQPGVKVLPSGLVYKVENPGDMTVRATADTDEVTVHYKGSKQNGEVFDATRYADMPADRQTQMRMYKPDSYDKDEPTTFTLNHVIRGWTEGMKLVGKGGKITLWIPSDLAYGDRGAGGVIAPYEALRFDIEVVDVKKK